MRDVIYMLKDHSVMWDSNLYVAFLCSLGGKGREFTDLQLTDGPFSLEHMKKLRRAYKFITRPRNYLGLILEAIEVVQ